MKILLYYLKKNLLINYNKKTIILKNTHQNNMKKEKNMLIIDLHGGVETNSYLSIIFFNKFLNRKNDQKPFFYSLNTTFLTLFFLCVRFCR